MGLIKKKIVERSQLVSRFMTNSDVIEAMAIFFLNDHSITKKELISMINEDIFRCTLHGTFGPIVGIVCYQRQPKYIEILLLYSHPEYNTKFIFGEILHELKVKLDIKMRTTLCFWVPDDSLETQLLLQENGFVAVEVHEDKYLMEYKL